MVKEIRTIEFVVLPVTKAKARKMFQIAGACRFVWNHFREKNLADYQAFRKDKKEKPKTSYFSLGVEFTKLRHETQWMLELPANPVKHTLKYFADALGEAMAGKKGFPKPRSKKRTAPGFTLPSTVPVCELWLRVQRGHECGNKHKASGNGATARGGFWYEHSPDEP